MASGVFGDFPKLTATVNALKQLVRIPSRVAAIAAPLIKEQLGRDTRAARNPYGKQYAPHRPATVKRWGPHPLLDLTGQGIGSLDARPMAGAGIEVTVDEHMRFTQGGTVNQDPRQVLPDNPSLPKAWRRILSDATEQAARDTMKEVK